MKTKLLFFVLSLTSFALLSTTTAAAAPVAPPADLEQCGGYGGPPPPPPGPPGPSYPKAGVGRGSTPSTPATPTTPARPSKPSSPGKPATPTGPVTPASPTTPGSPAAPGAPVTEGGAPLPTEHGRTAKSTLKLRWNYPVHKFFSPEKIEAFTVAKAYPTAMSRSKAFAEVAGDDKRPLLVLRECHYCNGTDDALLQVASGNERTLLLTRWFHCVKLPLNVLHEDHVFRNLFDEEHPPHAFLANWDGTNIIPIEADANQNRLWDQMYTMLASTYKKDARKAVKELELLVAQYDMYDEKITRLEYQYEFEVEEGGEKSRKAKKLRKELDALNKDLGKLQKQEAKLSDLGLKQAR